MPFLASKLLQLATEPSVLLLLCSLAGLGLLCLRRRRLALALLVLPIAFRFALLLLPLDAWVLAPLEDRFPPHPALPARMAGIICLGGAVDPAMTEARGIPALNAAAERMTMFVTLALRHPEARLAFTGGSGRLMDTGLSEADVARMLFDQLGLAGRDITYEGRSRTTAENARDLAALLHPRADQQWVLVTSAAHMPRAVALFRAAGWHVIPYPVAFQTGHSLATEIGPTLPERLGRLDMAAHEWGGLAALRLSGRTRQLVPGP